MRTHDSAFTTCIIFFCYHKANCNMIKTWLYFDVCFGSWMLRCTRIHTYRDTRVSGAVLEASQRCFVIESSLLWQTHCLFPPLPTLLTLSFECSGGPFLHAVWSSYLTVLHLQLEYCLSLSSSYLLHQLHVSSSKSWQPCRVQWSGSYRLERDQEYHIRGKTWW